MPTVKLFCLPYAGGSSLIFNNWRDYLDGSVVLYPVELTGRGRRISEPLYKNVDGMLDDIFSIIKEELLRGPYAFFGHSMGAFLAYELAVRIRSLGIPPPLHIFFSGRHAPHVPMASKNYHLLNDNDFREAILKLGGSPKELFDDIEMMNLFLPMLRNDFKLAESYEWTHSVIPFNFDISVFLGKDEEFSDEQVAGWKHHSNGSCSIQYYPGNHFFINDYQRSIISWIKFKLNSALARSLLFNNSL
jgi:medium-chain acyl-[acyl-carrier-protein] hydrolase